MTNVALTDSANLNKRKLNVLVRRLKCTHLPVMDTGIKGSKADPFVLFASYPKEMLWKKVHTNNGNGAWPSTYVIPNNLNPVWKVDFPLIFEHEFDNYENPSLSGSMLYLTVMDCDYSSGDDAIGTVALNLFDLCSDLNYNNHSSCDMSSPISARRKSIFGGRRGAPLVTTTPSMYRKLIYADQSYVMGRSMDGFRVYNNSGILYRKRDTTIPTEFKDNIKTSHLYRSTLNVQSCL